LDSTGSGQGPVAGFCECGDEPSGSYATELVSQLVSYLCSSSFAMNTLNNIKERIQCHFGLYTSLVLTPEVFDL
jgi:hypothetical protein